MAKRLLESDDSENEIGGVSVNAAHDLQVNDAYAKRFVHNKKREELRKRTLRHRLMSPPC